MSISRSDTVILLDTPLRMEKPKKSEATIKIESYLGSYIKIYNGKNVVEINEQILDILQANRDMIFLTALNVRDCPQKPEKDFLICYPFRCLISRFHGKIMIAIREVFEGRITTNGISFTTEAFKIFMDKVDAYVLQRVPLAANELDTPSSSQLEHVPDTRQHINKRAYSPISPPPRDSSTIPFIPEKRACLQQAGEPNPLIGGRVHGEVINDKNNILYSQAVATALSLEGYVNDPPEYNFIGQNNVQYQAVMDSLSTNQTLTPTQIASACDVIIPPVQTSTPVADQISTHQAASSQVGSSISKIVQVTGPSEDRQYVADMLPVQPTTSNALSTVQQACSSAGVQQAPTQQLLCPQQVSLQQQPLSSAQRPPGVGALHVNTEDINHKYVISASQVHGNNNTKYYQQRI